ncbi:MAG TPA: hypothetical protein VH082_02435 [Rudaea sp.]|jgi:hypothetical protein|nr:hypothetical protein [Rudaea sp.]
MPNTTQPIDIPIAEPTSTLAPWLIVLFAGSFGVILAAGVTLQWLMPDDSMPFYFTGGAIVFAFVLSMFLRWLIRRVGIAVVGENLVVRTGVGRRSFALSNLRAGGLRVIDLTQHGELDTIGKRWSATMPNLKTGLFRLRNNERAIVVVADPRRVSYLRSDADALTLLLSLKHPDRLRAILER